MNHIGYCVTKNGSAVGICPIGWLTATRTLERYKARDDNAAFEIVAIYASNPISVTTPPALEVASG